MKSGYSNLRTTDLTHKRAFSPDIERSSLEAHNKLFSDTTAESLNANGMSSTITSPFHKTRDGNTKGKMQDKT